MATKNVKLGMIIRKMLSEELDHIGIKKVVDAASKLLTAVKSFKQDATHEMQNAVTPHLSDIEANLEKMVSDPQSWVTRQRKIISLTAQKESVNKKK